MTRQIVNVGAVPGDGTGDKGQVPFNKVNANDAELYASAAYYGVDSGAANAYVVALATFVPNPTSFSLTTGALLRFTALNPNTGAATLNAGGTGAIAVVGQNRAALVGGEINQTPIWVQYNGSAWQIICNSNRGGVNVLDYGIVPNSSGSATANNAALVKLLSPVANGGDGINFGQVWFPTGQTWYLNQFIAVKPGMYIDLGFGTIMFVRVGAGGEYTDCAVFTGLSDYSVENGTININYTGTIGSNCGGAIFIGARASECTLFPNTFDSLLAVTQGRVTLRNLTITSNVAHASAIESLGGVRDVIVENITVAGQGVMDAAFQYEWGYATNEMTPSLRQSSHCFNVNLRNIVATNLNSTTGFGVGFFGAYHVTVEGLYVNGSAGVISCGTGEAANFRPWANVDDVGIKRGVTFRNVVGEALSGDAIAISGITEWTGELSPLASTAQEFNIIGLAEYTIDTFTVSSSNASGSGVGCDGNKIFLRNGRITGFNQGIFNDGTLILETDHVDIFNCPVAAMRNVVGDPYIAGRTDSRLNVRNGEIAGNGIGILFESGQVNAVIENMNFGYNNRATGEFVITGGTSSPGVNKVTSITVNGVNILGASIDWVTSNAATAAALATQINTFTSAPDYTAVVQPNNATVVIRANAGTGTTPNGFVVVVNVAGNVTAGSIKNMSGGIFELTQVNSVKVSAPLYSFLTGNVVVRNCNTRAVATGGNVAYLSQTASPLGCRLQQNIGDTSYSGGWLTDQGSFVSSISGFNPVLTPTVTYSVSGNQCTFSFPALSGTCNGTAAKDVSGGPNVFPAVQTYFPIFISDNGGAYIAATGFINTNGDIQLFAGPNNNTWSGAGTSAIRPFCISFSLV